MDYNIHNVNKTQQPMRDVHVSYVIPSVWYRIEYDDYDPTRSKFLVPEKSCTRRLYTRKVSCKSFCGYLSKVTWFRCTVPHVRRKKSRTANNWVQRPSSWTNSWEKELHNVRQTEHRLLLNTIFINSKAVYYGVSFQDNTGQ